MLQGNTLVRIDVMQIMMSMALIARLKKQKDYAMQQKTCCIWLVVLAFPLAKTVVHHCSIARQHPRA